MSEGPFVDQIYSSLGVIEIPVSLVSIVYSLSIELNLGEYFAVAYKATSDGNVKLKIEFQESHDNSSFVVATGFADIESALADELWHIKKIEPVCMPYGRVKITGLGAPSANDASTTLQFKLGRLLL
jgi:hypothetical protein